MVVNFGQKLGCDLAIIVWEAWKGWRNEGRIFEIIL
jgi:hypothetical protein